MTTLCGYRRDLVAFTYFTPDIAPGGGPAEMQAGTKAHQARESAQAEDFEIKKPLNAELERNGETVTLFGRMDPTGRRPSLRGEIKLCARPPQSPLPELRAQALLYGAMLALADESLQTARSAWCTSKRRASLYARFPNA